MAKPFKAILSVLENGSILPGCSCTWRSPVAVSQISGLSQAILVATKMYDEHEHVPVVKKERKNAKRKA